jgi:hypothetical protein
LRGRRIKFRFDRNPRNKKNLTTARELIRKDLRLSAAERNRLRVSQIAGASTCLRLDGSTFGKLGTVAASGQITANFVLTFSSGPDRGSEQPGAASDKYTQRSRWLDRHYASFEALTSSFLSALRETVEFDLIKWKSSPVVHQVVLPGTNSQARVMLLPLLRSALLTIPGQYLTAVEKLARDQGVRAVNIGGDELTAPTASGPVTELFSDHDSESDRSTAIGFIDSGLNPADREFRDVPVVFAKYDRQTGLFRRMPAEELHPHGHGTLVVKRALQTGGDPKPLVFMAAALNGMGADIPSVRMAFEWLVQECVPVLNCSFFVPSGTDPDRHGSFDDVLQRAHEENTKVVAAAGNEKCSRVGTPARHPHVLSVGAIDESDSFWLGNSHADCNGSFVPLYSAPGYAKVQNGKAVVRDIKSSFASPIVAGLYHRAIKQKAKPLDYLDKLSTPRSVGEFAPHQGVTKIISAGAIQ